MFLYKSVLFMSACSSVEMPIRSPLGSLGRKCRVYFFVAENEQYKGSNLLNLDTPAVVVQMASILRAI